MSNPRNAGGGAFERVSGWTTSARATDASAPRHTSYGHRPRDRHVASALSEDGIDDDDVDDADDDEEMSFGDIDRLASAAESKRRAGDTGTDTGVVAANPGKNDLVEFGLTGRPLFVCQSIWWLRLSQLKTYPPNDSEVRGRRATLRPLHVCGRAMVQRRRSTTTITSLSRTRRRTTSNARRSSISSRSSR